MAYVDKNLEFSDAQAVTVTALATNVYDTATVGVGGGTNLAANLRQNLGNGSSPGDMWLVVTVQTTLAAGTSLAVTFETADDAALSTNATVLLTSGTVLTANLGQGTTLIAARIPSALYRRYIGVRYTVAGTYTSGAVDAYMTPNLQANPIYKSGFAVQ